MASQTPAERRAAQRRLAKEIKTGTYKPSKIGAKAREAAKDYRAEKTRIVNKIRALKNRIFGDTVKFNQKRSDKWARVNPETGKDWTISELRDIEKSVDAANAGDLDYFEIEEFKVIDGLEYDDSPFFYH